jgi:hypothetical protein
MTMMGNNHSFFLVLRNSSNSRKKSIYIRACLGFIYTTVASEKAPIGGATNVVWLFQMSEEQLRVALFQAQPGGLGLIFCLTALSLAYLEQPNHTRSAWLGKK